MTGTIRMKKKMILTLISICSLLLFTGCSMAEVLDLGIYTLDEITTDLKQPEKLIEGAVQPELNLDIFESGDYAFALINNNVSTLSFDNWTTEKVNYSDLDSSNRVGEMTAFLSKKNIGKSNNRNRQNWKPTGWHNQQKTIGGKNVSAQNRGHLLAYTLSFNFDEDGIFKSGQDGSEDNPRNLFTQTEYANQEIMTIFEEKVRQSLKENKRVIYRVKPDFRDQELMARGVHLEAISDDGLLNFNVYIWNVQPSFVYEYSTSRFAVNKEMMVTKNSVN